MELNNQNINKNIDSTLTLLYNQYKEYIEITKEYCDDSEIECNPGQINQEKRAMVGDLAEGLSTEIGKQLNAVSFWTCSRLTLMNRIENIILPV